MLAIRMQRTGRSGHAQFRVIVQDSRFSPTRGRVVSYLGSYNPHNKVATIDSEKAAHYLKEGAQPSETVARLFKKEGIKLPVWVNVSEPRKRTVRNPEKRRATAPAQPEQAAPEAETAGEPAAEADTQSPEKEAAAEPEAETPSTEEAPAEEAAPAEETPQTPTET
jgi:small subunit ribosomal protein S16